MSRSRRQLVRIHVAMLALALGLGTLAATALAASRATSDSARQLAEDALAAHRAVADVRALFAMTWRYALGGDPADRLRARDLARPLDRAPLGDGELLEAVDAAASTSEWALDQPPSQDRLARIASELDGAAWRLDAALLRHLEQRGHGVDPTMGAWSQRAALALLAAVVFGLVASSVVVVRELARQEKGHRLHAERDRQLRQQRTEIVRASQDVQAALRSIIRADSFDTVRDLARHLEDQLAGLFDVTRLALGDTSLRREYCDSRALVRHAMHEHDSLATARAIRLRSEAGIAGPVLADRARIGHVLSMLIGSAMRAAPPGAEIVVTTAPEPRAVRFAVSDVTPRTAPDAFAPRREPDASSLELATCRRLVEAHGGAFGVEHGADRGSTYWFTLPDEPRLLR